MANTSLLNQQNFNADMDALYDFIKPYLVGVPKIKTATLSASATTVTFTGLPTTGNHIIDFTTSTGINYTEIDTSTLGQATLTFEAQESVVTVYCRIEEVA